MSDAIKQTAGASVREQAKRQAAADVRSYVLAPGCSWTDGHADFSGDVGVTIGAGGRLMLTHRPHPGKPSNIPLAVAIAGVDSLPK